jgi:hypothetical protein
MGSSFASVEPFPGLWYSMHPPPLPFIIVDHGTVTNAVVNPGVLVQRKRDNLSSHKPDVSSTPLCFWASQLVDRAAWRAWRECIILCRGQDFKHE